jgi:hypothetical protein
MMYARPPSEDNIAIYYRGYFSVCQSKKGEKRGGVGSLPGIFPDFLLFLTGKWYTIASEKSRRNRNAL